MIRFIPLILVFATITMVSCNNNSPIGAGLITGQQFDITSVDTITVRSSTVAFDSLPTSNSGRLLFGYHTDTKLGSVISSSAFQLAPTTTKLDPNLTEYRKLALRLVRDKYYFYDTTRTVTMKVYRLLKPIVAYSGYRYNADRYTIDPATPLGTLTFLPRPTLKDSVEVVLSDDLGKQLMSMVQKGDDAFTSSDKFGKFFNGLVILPDSTNTSTFIGFLPSPVMRLYYHDYGVQPGSNAEKYVTFIIGGSNFYYNRIHGDRSGTKLSSLKTSKQSVSSTKTDHESYVQGGTGVAIRLDFPHLGTLNYLQSKFQATKAILNLNPVRSSITPFTPPPTALYMDLVDGANNILASRYVTVALQLDPYGVYSYNADVTSFVNGEVQTYLANDKNALLLRLADDDYRAKINRLYLGDQLNTNYTIKLRVYYITLIGQQ